MLRRAGRDAEVARSRAGGARLAVPQPPRWQNFRANRRGYWSFWIFMVLLVLSLGAEFIANDKPFYVRHDGRSYFPVFTTYSETAFGGEFETAADYRDPYLQKLIADKGGTILWPPIRYSTTAISTSYTGAVAADLEADRDNASPP